ncbi:hypothetical protein SQ56_22210 [Klebsiella variicola]|nr:hypothetical protein SQ56_22210 [Klebsiella variicola]HBX2031920.1 hypothetical protein [Klebsiella variicola]
MQGRQYSVTCYQQTLEKQLINKWQGPPTTKKPAPAVFYKTNGESGMSNSNIMALALRLNNRASVDRVRIPVMTGLELRILLEWLSVLRVTV